MLKKIELLGKEKKQSQLEGVKYALPKCNCLCPPYTCGMDCGGLGNDFGVENGLNAEVNTASMFYTG